MVLSGSTAIRVVRIGRIGSFLLWRCYEVALGFELLLDFSDFVVREGDCHLLAFELCMESFGQDGHFALKCRVEFGLCLGYECGLRCGPCSCFFEKV